MRMVAGGGAGGQLIRWGKAVPKRWVFEQRSISSDGMPHLRNILFPLEMVFNKPDQ